MDGDGVRAVAQPLEVPPSPDRSIFVVGNSRSGTTVVANALGLHSLVFMFQELHFFERLWTSTERGRTLTADHAVSLAARLLCIQRDGILFQGDARRFRDEAMAIVASLDERAATAESIFAAFLHYETEKHGKRIPCDQTPRNVYYIESILSLFPGARVLVMVRDPRDVVASQKHKWRTRFHGSNGDPILEAIRVKAHYHPVTTSLLWNAAVKAGDRWASDDRVHILRFEDLLTRPDVEMNAVCRFLGIPFEAGMLQVPQVNSSYAREADGQLGFRPEAIGRWKRGRLSDAETFLCQRIAARNMARHGYSLHQVRPSFAMLVWHLVLWPVKLVLGLAFNLNQVRSWPEALKRRLDASGGLRP